MFYHCMFWQMRDGDTFSRLSNEYSADPAVRMQCNIFSLSGLVMAYVAAVWIAFGCGLVRGTIS